MSIFNGNRIVIAGTNSGSGKTTVTCAILKCLLNKGYKVSCYKCGPDYIDPMFHKSIIGVPTYNLDNYFCDSNTIKNIFATNSKKSDISVIEGVMGYYDGISFDSDFASTYTIADILNANTILVINVRGMAYSVNALINGFLTLKENSHIKGIIFNNVTEKMYSSLKMSVEKNFKDVKCLGYLPKLPDELIIESRHLGLVTADEIDALEGKIEKLSTIAEQTLNIDEIFEISKCNEKIEYQDIKKKRQKLDVKIAVARDNAFCFYYEENLKLLKSLVAKIVYFSPIKSKKLPKDTDAIYIGGGYPELYADALSKNVSMRESIKSALNDKMPCIAECGGFMYLNKSIEGKNMVGYFNGECKNEGHLVNFGYKNIISQNDNLLFEKGDSIRGHEFHYYGVTDYGNDCICKKVNGLENKAIFANKYIFAGFPHLYFNSNISAIERFVNKALEYKNIRENKK